MAEDAASIAAIPAIVGCDEEISVIVDCGNVISEVDGRLRTLGAVLISCIAGQVRPVGTLLVVVPGSGLDGDPCGNES